MGRVESLGAGNDWEARISLMVGGDGRAAWKGLPPGRRSFVSRCFFFILSNIHTKKEHSFVMSYYSWTFGCVGFNGCKMALLIERTC